MNKLDLSDYIGKIHRIMRDHNDYDMEIQYILYRKSYNQDLQFKAVCFNSDDPNEIIGITNIEGYEKYYSIPDWDYNVDTYLFEDLSNDFEILYISLNTHYGIWQFVNEAHDDIECEDGLQKYLCYCKQEGINADILSRIIPHKVDDIMDLYREENCGYQIIAETTCNEQTIVLGYKKGASSEYVTWSTNSNRKGEYLSGHYFTKYKPAMNDFKERCFDIMNKEVIKIKKKCEPQRNNNIR
ncbi:hypothetical protein [Candidatus Stoquefichus massiliensis]|uniref:hypothetical protein n=1 Tax=Candidatus Stoquefichus massiliensis TaxID=1470350 RepID=UPI0004880A9C|nr:hypothetical protein [Candidatus Stoquefichus massiliensis]